MKPVTDKGSHESILGFDVWAGGLSACINDIVTRLRTEGQAPSCHWLACINPHSYALTKHNEKFAQALRAADWLIPDGIGIVLASRHQGGAIKARVTGSDIFQGLMSELNQRAGRVFFLGSSQATLDAIRARLALDFPSVKVVGMYSPPYTESFSPEESDAMITMVNAARPDVLWVGLTSPKQDLWLHEHHQHLCVGFAAGIGAVFDFYANTVKRSAPIFQRLGLEWLPRLLREPRRLWRRMFISAPLFMWDVLKTAPSEAAPKGKP